jgi:hypothetical protein
VALDFRAINLSRISGVGDVLITQADQNLASFISKRIFASSVMAAD